MRKDIFGKAKKGGGVQEKIKGSGERVEKRCSIQSIPSVNCISLKAKHTDLLAPE